MIRIAHRTQPLDGERENGDCVFTRVDPTTGHALISVIDGLGHGPKAAEAASKAKQHLEQEGFDQPASEILRRLHHGLRGTRGVAATVCVLAGDALSACGVGNVALRSTGTPISFMLSPGILGARVRSFREIRAKLRFRDRILLHSDGIGPSFSLESVGHLDTEAACESIFTGYRKPTDDATVLVMDVD